MCIENVVLVQNWLGGRAQGDDDVAANDLNVQRQSFTIIRTWKNIH